MNQGSDRSFQDGTVFELVTPISGADLMTDLVDHGIHTINIPFGDTQHELDQHFPYRPGSGRGRR